MKVMLGNIKGEKGLEPLQVKSIFNSSYTTIDQTTPCPKSDFNRTPIVGDVFMNMDGASNMGKWIVIESDNDKTTVMIKLLSCVSCKGKNGIPGDGSLNGERIAQSSGDESLDNAALEAVRSANAVGPKPAGFPSGLSVPISFTLQ